MASFYYNQVISSLSSLHFMCRICFYVCFLSSSWCWHGHISVIFFLSFQVFQADTVLMPIFFSCFFKVLKGCVFLCFFRVIFGHILYSRMPLFFRMGVYFALFNFFGFFFGFSRLIWHFLMCCAGCSGTEVSSMQCVFLFVFFYVLSQHYLFLIVCYLFGVLVSVNLQLYIHSSLLFSRVIGHYVTCYALFPSVPGGKHTLCTVFFKSKTAFVCMCLCAIMYVFAFVLKKACSVFVF